MLLAAREGAGPRGRHRRASSACTLGRARRRATPPSCCAAARRPAVAGRSPRDLVSAAAGNPLALVELPRALSEDAALGPRGAAAGAARRAVARRRRSAASSPTCPRATRDALLVAAAADGGEDVTHLVAALAAARPRRARARRRRGGRASSCSRARACASATRCCAPPPTTRASPPERRAAHRALAETAPEGAASRAWHLAAAITAADEDVARDLEDAANDARRRGGHASAARAFARAAELTPEPAERARRLLEAAIDHVAAGALEQAETDADAGAAARRPTRSSAPACERIRAHVLVRSGRPGEGAEAMVARRRGGRGRDPAARRGDAARGGARHAAHRAGRRGAASSAERAKELGERRGDHRGRRRRARRRRRSSRSATGRRRRSCFDAREAFLLDADPPPGVSEAIAAGAHGVDVARAVRPRAAHPRPPHRRSRATRARWRGSATRSPSAPSSASAAGTGPRRYADAEEAARVLAGDRPGEHPRVRDCRCSPRSRRAWAASPRRASTRGVARPRRGGPRRRSSARTRAPRSARSRAGEDDARRPRSPSTSARARDLVAIGMPAPGELFWTVELVELHARAGATDKAAGRGRAPRRRSSRRPTRRSTRRSSRAAARSSPTATRPRRSSSEAMERHARSHDAVRARAHRARDRRAAAPRPQRAPTRATPLRAALETFERLGARWWAERARSELRASGAASGARRAAVAEVLTPHELQVAMIVARGRDEQGGGRGALRQPEDRRAPPRPDLPKLDLRSRTELDRAR